MKHRILHLLAVAVSLPLLAACDGNADGTLTLGVTDAPVDNATRVVVEFSGVSVKPANGEEIAFEYGSPRQIDLLALHGGETELLLDGVSLDIGEYEWIRLHVNAGLTASDSWIDLDDGSRHALYIPSGNQSGLKVVQGFVVPINGNVDFTIDFDLRKSVTNPTADGTPYILRPTLRMVDNAEVGAIAGTVNSGTATATDCAPAVYVYEGSDVTPEDVGSFVEPIASGLVEMNDATGEFEYRVAFLTAGEYTVALTCDADQDDPETEDGITFEGQQNATVEVDQTTTVSF